ncbi:MAG: hypothetical protein JSV35_05650 [Candidatus Bathyarchaeota archaeon]|nr:MAG: hypothetical protein JSV35_05650 [Candidatus Bathyarchaeota archaeon]
MSKLTKKEEKELTTKPIALKPTDLDVFCGGDKELSNALWYTMFLDPRKIKTTLRDAEKNAVAFEKDDKLQNARIWYHIAGGLALWKGDEAKVKIFFEKCGELAPESNYRPITAIPKKAVEAAAKYYKEYLK